MSQAKGLIMVNKDPNISVDIVNAIDESQVIMIEGERRSGRFTFVSFLINTMLNKKAAVFIPQEEYLFQRRLDLLARFQQLGNIHERFETYYLKAEWPEYKQRYGYAFLKQELKKIITESDADIIFFHRFEEFFEFQDLYEIKPVLLSLFDEIRGTDKKLVISISDTGQHAGQIKESLQDFSDLSVCIKISSEDEREIRFTDNLYHRVYPTFRFQLSQNLLSLKDEKSDMQLDSGNTLGVFLCSLSEESGAVADLMSYLFADEQRFSFHQADTLDAILNNLFLYPDVIIFLLQRTDENLQMLQQVRKLLPEAKLYAFFTQDFMRSEDRRMALSKGCDEVFAANFKVADFIAAVEKDLKRPFYQNQLRELESEPHALPDRKKLQEIVESARERQLYFTIFVYAMKDGEMDFPEGLGREYDYYLAEEQKLVLLAMNTGPREAEKIGEHLRANGIAVDLERTLEGHKVDQVEGVL
jgi:hypothetical protein